MQNYILTGLCLLATIGLYGTASAVEPIWISPLTVNPGADIPESYDASKNVWANISTGAGSRGVMPIVAMDSKGILWILGGTVNRDNTGDSLFNVWNYNPKTDQYRYVWGSSDTARSDPINVGELRVPNELNHPGKIYYSLSTIDKNDNIWFASSEHDGELWMFNTTSMLFTRMQGTYPDTGLVSIGAEPGQPAQDVWPGFVEAACMITDSMNNLWILAGANSNGYTNTVWHFNTTSYLWTFIAGDPTQELALNHNATFYGGTWAPGCFVDENDKVWLFGGYGRTRDSYANYGSLWTFDTRGSRQWVLEWGVDTAQSLPLSVSSNYDPDNRPGSGQGQILVDRLDGTLMMVPNGGNNDAGDLGLLNQLWLYNKTLKQWKLVHGDTSSLDAAADYVSYRQTGNSYPGSFYPGRGIDMNGDVYIVGGGVGPYSAVPNRNDIWLIPNDQCSSPTANKCDANADCIEDMFGYSCVCKQGYTGDGFTCTPAPVAPIAVPVGAPGPGTPVAATPKKQTSSASVIGSAVALTALVFAL